MLDSGRKRNSTEINFRARFNEYLRSIKRTKNKSVLLELFQILKASKQEIYLFGGFPRDIFFHKSKAIPRDVDLVVNSNNLTPILQLFTTFEITKSRFGGYKIKFNGLDVDIWPLESTWAFLNTNVPIRGIESLAQTTFLNIESIAIELFPQKRQRKVILDGFIDAIESRVFELNLEQNPFPDLNIARALYVAKNMNYSFGPKLITFIAYNISKDHYRHIFDIYKKKYGLVEREERIFTQFFNSIKAIPGSKDKSLYTTFQTHQMNLFE